jgi:hypothetical protein
LLGIAPQATASEINAAWRNKARATHPDLHPDDPGALERMCALNVARDVALRAVDSRDTEQEHAPERHGQATSPSSLDPLLTMPMPRSARIRGLRPTVEVRSAKQRERGLRFHVAIVWG